MFYYLQDDQILKDVKLLHTIPLTFNSKNSHPQGQNTKTYVTNVLFFKFHFLAFHIKKAKF